ncbi:hypothetical protein ABZY06_33805 [Streptomyces sp. NPDC006540]|uniref:DUF7336 domain-containing protein n=1 Tax=Streptomyces sp. NPDC006540 TaxID=3155353 RepID=UPI0033ABD66A
MANAYVVTQGSYSDYRIVKVFSDEGAANRLAESLNRQGGYGDDAEVEVHEMGDADWSPGQYMMREAHLAIISGDVLDRFERTRIDVTGEYAGHTNSDVQLRMGYWRVWTSGDAERVPQAHADAVARKRAEIIGL